MIEDVLAKIAQDSAIATVAVFAIWKQAQVMIALANALVAVSKSNAETLSEQAEHLK